MTVSVASVGTAWPAAARRIPGWRRPAVNVMVGLGLRAFRPSRRRHFEFQCCAGRPCSDDLQPLAAPSEAKLTSFG